MRLKHFLFSFVLVIGVFICFSAMPETKNTDSTISGIDISHFQDDEIDYLNKKGSQLDFVICKATEGLTYTDPDFTANWKTIQQQGFVRGAYHFYHCADDPTQQANYFLSTVGTFLETDLPPIVDFEENSIDKNCSKATIQKNLLQFLTILEQKTGKKPILYTDTNIGNSEISDPAFSNYYLWIADYNPVTSPTVPSVWKTKSWTLWQKTQNYSLDSYTNDFDVFNGTSEDFANLVIGN
jgi:lysozyme